MTTTTTSTLVVVLCLCAVVLAKETPAPPGVLREWTLVLTYEAKFVPPLADEAVAAAPAVLINGSLTGPTLRAQWGDTLRVTFVNEMPEATTVHFHGIWQRENHYVMDGVPFVTQCPIPAGSAFTYEFPLDQYGTYWYHSHVGWHRDLGLFGTLIVDPPADRSIDRHLYDAEHVMQVSDWFADDPAQRFAEYRSGPCHRIDVVTLLCNGKGHDTFHVEPGKGYRFRVVGAMANSMVKISFEGHRVTVVSADGWDVVHRTVNSFMMASGETYDVLLRTHANPATTTFAVRAMVHPHKGCATDDASTLKMPSFDIATVEYSAGAGSGGGTPPPPPSPPLHSETLDTSTLRPHAPYASPPCECNLTVNILRDDSDARYIINQRLFAFPSTPLSMGGAEADTIVLPCPRGASVCMAINNQDFLHHPIHTHGHHFRVLGSGPGVYDANTAALDFSNRTHKHTSVVHENAWIVFQFMAINEGYWLVHCHMSFHVEAGLAWVLKIGEPVRAPDRVRALCGDAAGGGGDGGKKVVLYDGNPVVVIGLLVVVVTAATWWLRRRPRSGTVEIRQDDGL